jgi:predicted DNA-binding transcriptional regulator AlpA
MQPRYYRVNQIGSTSKRQGLIGANPSTIWRWAADGKFPKPIKLSEKVTVWDANEIDAWIASKRDPQVTTPEAPATPMPAPKKKVHALGVSA